MDAAEGLGVPLDFLAVPAIVACAAAIGRSVAVRPKVQDRWIERAILWGAVIGRPSSGKSPALAPARRMLARLESEAAKAHAAAVADAMAEQNLHVANAELARSEMRAAVKAKDIAAAARLAREAIAPPPEIPPEPRIVMADATVEKLGELLNANPRGLLMVRDELAGWLASLDKEGHEGDRSFWLECWNGTGPFVVDRIGRGTVRIEACAVSVLGGIQPGKLADYVRGAVKGGMGDDGLMQRFQLAVYPDLPASWRYRDAAPNAACEMRAHETFQRLRATTPESVGAMQGDGFDLPWLPLADDARELWIEWQSAMMPRLRAGGEPAHMESHLAKFPALACRLALVLHLCDADGGPVSGEAMARALDWCAYLESHARRIYAPLADGGLSAAHALLKKRKELPDVFTARDVYRHQWSGLDAKTTTDALNVLAEYGHLIELPPEQGAGRPSARYQWSVAL
ncbi:YfjI family protein [Metallibacterium scheffleri]